jgi:uncharacterized protein YabE (DUF348 family)
VRNFPPLIPHGLIALAGLALLGGMAAGYQAGLTPVTLVVDGEARQVRTHQETVGLLLLDAGLELYPEDIVEPAFEEALEPGMTIRLLRARPIQMVADGRTWQMRTHAVTTDQMLSEAGISLGPDDRVDVSSRAASDEGGLRVQVKRAVPVVVHEDGRALTLHTTAATVGGALREAGFQLYLADRVAPGLAQPLSAGMHVFVERSMPVTVQVDGRTLRTRTHRDRVGQVLADLGIVLSGQDYTRPSADETVLGDTTIEVVRVSERFLIRQEPIPFAVVWQADPDLELDQQRLIQDGAPGVLERRLRVRYENGVEVSRTQENEYVAVPPATKTIGYGTRVVVRQLETPEGPVEYWRVIRMLATSYSASTAGTPRSSPYYGRTRLGWTMRHGIVAVDPRVVALRTEVYVPGYGMGVAGDTGGAIRRRRIDLGYDDDNLVLWYRWVDVYLLTPVPSPDRINYILDS